MAARKATVLVVAAAVASLATSCGGGGGGDRLTKSQLIRRGDAICTKYRAKNQALNESAPAKNPTDPSATDAQVKASAPILERLADNVRGARGEFSDLNPPRELDSDWDNTLDDLDALATRLDLAADAAKELDRQKVVDEFGEILRLNRRVNGFQVDYGFKVCGKNA